MYGITSFTTVTLISSMTQTGPGESQKCIKMYIEDYIDDNYDECVRLQIDFAPSYVEIILFIAVVVSGLYVWLS